MNTEMAARFKFSDFTAELKVVADEKGQKICLNGEEMDWNASGEKDYERISDPDEIDDGDWFQEALY